MSAFDSQDGIAKTSSELLKIIFGRKFDKPRKLTEPTVPTTQGQNACKLAEYIILHSNSNSNKQAVELANRFLKYYNEDICYICGAQIADSANAELDHVLPIAEALAFNLIIPDNKCSFKKQIVSIYNSNQATGYLLEYAKTHRCCNQLKGAKSMIAFDGLPPYDKPYKINESEIELLLVNIWNNTIGRGRKYADGESCKNNELINHLKIKHTNVADFVEKRKTQLIHDFFQPLIDFIYNISIVSGHGDIGFSTLLFIANQGSNVSDKAWNLYSQKNAHQNGQSNANEYPMLITNVLSRLVNESNQVDLQVLVKKCVERLKTNYETNADGEYIPNLGAHTVFRQFDILNSAINKSFESTFLDYYSKKVDEYGQAVTINSENLCKLFGYEYIYLLLISQPQQTIKNQNSVTILSQIMNNISEYMMFVIYLCHIVEAVKPDLSFDVFLKFVTINTATVDYDNKHKELITALEYDELTYTIPIFRNNGEYVTYIDLEPLTVFSNFVIYNIYFNRLNAANALLDLKPATNVRTSHLLTLTPRKLPRQYDLHYPNRMDLKRDLESVLESVKKSTFPEQATNVSDLKSLLPNPKKPRSEGGTQNKVPMRYLPAALTHRDRSTQMRLLRKSRRLYKTGKFYTRKRLPSFHNKESAHIVKARKIYGIASITPSPALAKATGCSIDALNQIVKKGEGAYYSSGSRPNQTAHSWAYARLASSITAGKSAAVDYKILERGCKHNKRAFRLAQKSRRKYGYGQSHAKRVIVQ